MRPPVKMEVAIREIRDKACGGDPQTAPVADRFRIYRKSKKIEWYDVDNDDYLEFSKVHSIDGR